MIRLRVHIAVIAFGIAVANRALDAQAMARGIVLDSTSRLPIAGAVVSTLDSLGRTGLRTLTNERGTFGISAAPPAHRLRIVRLGFQPVDVMLPRGDSASRLAIVMARIPYELQAVRVMGSQKCARRRDRAAALALLEQARAGLLATVVARSARPARMTRVMFDRRYDGATERIVRHHVTVDTTSSSVASFKATYSAIDFVRDGFTTGAGDGAIYHAPDADVQLDDGFANGYCFHIMDRARTRPNQVGLGFRSADRGRGRVDVDGALWIDTVARALVDIEFRYVGLPAAVERLDPGGRVEFREMPNGVVLITRWVLRVVSGTTDTTATAMAATIPGRITRENRSSGASAAMVVAEAGGELARVAWPGGVAWESDLARVSLTVTAVDGKPMRSTTVWLDDTNYRATTDSLGRVEIGDLSPGPYAVRIVDPRLEPIDFTLPTSSTFTAARGAVIKHTVRARKLEDYVGERCREDWNAIVRREPWGSVAWVIGRITTPTGEPIVGLTAGVPYKFPIGATAPTVSADLFASHHDIGSDGIFVFCSLVRGTSVPITFKRGKARVGHVMHVMVDPLNVVPVQFSPDFKR